MLWHVLSSWTGWQIQPVHVNQTCHITVYLALIHIPGGLVLGTGRWSCTGCCPPPHTAPCRRKTSYTTLRPEKDKLHDPPPWKRPVTRPSALKKASYTTLRPEKDGYPTLRPAKDELHEPPPWKRWVTRPSALQKMSYTTLSPAKDELHKPPPWKIQVTHPSTLQKISYTTLYNQYIL